jgi:cytochrome c oxidase assembly factor CtaG
VVWLALETPLDVIADERLQSVHMLQHVLLGVVAAPLLVLGLTPGMAAVLARSVPLLRPLAEPVPAQLIAGAVMVAWHLPALYDLTLQSEAIHVFEHLTFIAAGVLFWWPALAATSPTLRWSMSDGAKLLYLLAGTLPQDAVALVLQFSRVAFYPFYTEPQHALPGWDPVVDQNVAGAVLMLAGKTSYAIALLAIFFRWLRRDEAREAGDEDEGRAPGLSSRPA